jgi:hypothetical protein
MFVELHLDDLVEAAIDGGKTFVHLFTETADLIVHLGAEAADLIAHVGADVLALFFDETRKFLELGLFVFLHAGQYTIRGGAMRTVAAHKRERWICKVKVRDVGGVFAKWDVIFQALDLQRDGGASARG